jgi:hypothetical protein
MGVGRRVGVRLGVGVMVGEGVRVGVMGVGVGTGVALGGGVGVGYWVAVANGVAVGRDVDVAGDVGATLDGSSVGVGVLVSSTPAPVGTEVGVFVSSILAPVGTGVDEAAASAVPVPPGPLPGKPLMTTQAVTASASSTAPPMPALSSVEEVLPGSHRRPTADSEGGLGRRCPHLRQKLAVAGLVAPQLGHLTVGSIVDL